jgi:hypothetical protein
MEIVSGAEAMRASQSDGGDLLIDHALSVGDPLGHHDPVLHHHHHETA